MRKSVQLALTLAAASLLASAAVAGGNGKGNGGGTSSGGGTTTGSTGLPIVAPCGTNDVTGTGVTLISCSGYISGNLLNTGKLGAEVPQALASVLYGSSDPKGNVLPESFSFNKTSDILTLVTPLKPGISILGIHYGAGIGGTGPGKESTAFYVLDAAQGVSQLHLKYSSYSNAELFVTGVARHVAAAPEPGTWMTMIMGFGFTGFQMRRRKRAATKLA